MQSDRYNSLRSLRSTGGAANNNSIQTAPDAYNDHDQQNQEQLEDALRSTLRSIRSRRLGSNADTDICVNDGVPVVTEGELESLRSTLRSMRSSRRNREETDTLRSHSTLRTAARLI